MDYNIVNYYCLFNNRFDLYEALRTYTFGMLHTQI